MNQASETVHAITVTPAEPDAPAPSQSYAPSRSQLAGAIGAVATWIVVVTARHFGLVLPADVVFAIPIIVGSILAYLTPPTARQVAARVDDRIVALAASLPPEESKVSKSTVVLPSQTTIVPSSKQA